MPVGGKLRLKGGLEVKRHGLDKKKKKKKSTSSKVSNSAGGLNETRDESVSSDLIDKDAGLRDSERQAGISSESKSRHTIKSYEEEFGLEMNKLKRTVESKAMPDVLHGYSTKVKGKTAEERLDLRSAMKSDKFCK